MFIKNIIAVFAAKIKFLFNDRFNFFVKIMKNRIIKTVNLKLIWLYIDFKMTLPINNFI